MGLMNAIGLQPRNPTTSVTSQGTQTLALQLQNAETQTEREIQEAGTAASGPGEGESPVMSVGKYGRGQGGEWVGPSSRLWLLHMDGVLRECTPVRMSTLPSLGSALLVALTTSSGRNLISFICH